MFDRPDARAILEEVQSALKAGIAPGFQQAVAANAVALALREEELAHAANQAERGRLVTMLGIEVDLPALNATLCAGIRAGSLTGPVLVDHLIRTTVDKLAVDQPNYPAYRAWKGETK